MLNAAATYRKFGVSTIMSPTETKNPPCGRDPPETKNPSDPQGGDRGLGSYPGMCLGCAEVRAENHSLARHSK